MTDSIRITGVDETIKAFEQFGERGAKLVKATKLKTQTRVFNETARRLSKEVAMTQKDIKNAKTASKGKALIKTTIGGDPGVRLSGSPIAIRRTTSAGTTQYKAKVLKKGASFQVRRDRGREKTLKAFEITTKQGAPIIVRSVQGQRTSTGKQRLKQLFGPSLPNALEHSGKLDGIQEFSKEQLGKNLEQRLDFELRKLAT